MKHLSAEQLYFSLKAGRSVEQWIGYKDECTYRIIQWLTIYAENGQYVVSYSEVFDEGNINFTDIYEFSAIDPDHAEGLISMFSTFQEALDYTIIEYNCSINKFVNSGMIQDEYLKYLENESH